MACGCKKSGKSSSQLRQTPKRTTVRPVSTARNGRVTGKRVIRRIIR